MTAQVDSKELFIGKKSDNTCFSIKPKSLLNHTAIIGQSGSGKSFLFGRIIEEYLLNTNGKAVIIDLNADFIRINQAKEDIWDEAKEAKAFNNLLKESYRADSSSDEFINQWQSVARFIHILGLRDDDPITISWKNLDINEWCQLLGIDKLGQPELTILLTFFVDYAKRKDWRIEYWNNLPRLIVNWAKKHYGRLEYGGLIYEESLAKYVAHNFSIQSSQQFANSLNNILSQNVLADSSTLDRLVDNGSYRLLCLNVARIKNPSLRLFVVSYLLNKIWNLTFNTRWHSINTGTDERTPINIFIDEAHKVAPQMPSNDPEQYSLDLIKQVASEGRKNGLFLTLATQRPQKLHDDILSECDNVCIMHLVNENDFSNIKKCFGIIKDSDIRFDDVAKFIEGQGFFAGKWVAHENIKIDHIAPQRTQSGGGNLKTDLYIMAGKTEQLLK